MYFKFFQILILISLITLFASAIRRPRKCRPRKKRSTNLKIKVEDYPFTKRDDKCVDVIFGQKIGCPYKYLEDLEIEETSQFMKKISDMSSKTFKKIPKRKEIEKKLNEYSKYSHYYGFTLSKNYYYYLYKSGSQKQYTLYRKKSIDAKEEVIYDINKYDRTGETTVERFAVSSDDKLIAVVFSNTKKSLKMIKFLEKDGKELKDTLKEFESFGMSFIFGSKGFVYSKYRDAKNLTSDFEFEDSSLYYHKIGTSQSEDILIATYSEDKTVLTSGHVSEDGNYLFVKYSKRAYFEEVIYYLDLSKFTYATMTEKPKLKHLIGNFDAMYTVIDSNKKEVFIQTKKSTESGRVLKLKLSKAHKGEKEWETIIKEEKNRELQYLHPFGKEHLLVECLESRKNKVYIIKKKGGKIVSEINLNSKEFIHASSNSYSNRFFVAIQDKASPYELHTLTLPKLEVSEEIVKMDIFLASEVKGINRKDYVLKKISFKNKKHQDIPLFMFHKKNLELNGKIPVILEGNGENGKKGWYGYDPGHLMFVKNFDGIYVYVGARNGSDYEYNWYEKNEFLKVENSINDVIDAAKYLVRAGYTIPSKLALYGSFDNDILTALVSQRTPNLFATVINKINILDMITYHKKTFTDEWIKKYGYSESKAKFESLFKLSPLNNYKKQTKSVQWPNTLIVNDGHDNTSTSEILKYLAELYNVLKENFTYQSNPVIAKFSKPSDNPFEFNLNNHVKMSTDTYSFIGKTMNLKWRN